MKKPEFIYNISYIKNKNKIKSSLIIHSFACMIDILCNGSKLKYRKQYKVD